MNTAIYAAQRMALAPPLSTGDSSSAFMSEPQAVEQPQAEDEQYIPTFFCRALYDYKSNDASSLSFRKNDIIEVLTRLETGWWDGLLGEERGWFPSNYVDVISWEEADAALSSSTYDTPQSTLQDDSIVDMGDTMSRALSDSDRDGDWLERDADLSVTNHRTDERNSVVGTNGRPHHDFWVPQVGPDSRIFYVNTQTGQRSQDLPQEAEEDVDHGLMPSIKPGSRPGSNAMNGPVQEAGFGIHRRSGTPEPWVRRLADDGMSYYYCNKLDGTLSWTLPTSDSPGSAGKEDDVQTGASRGVVTPSNGIHQLAGQTRMRSDSSASSRERSYNATDRLSVYSDDSDVQPLQRPRAESSTSAVKASNGSYSIEPTIPTIPEQTTAAELTPAEQAARALQRSLSPPLPDSPSDMANAVCEAISNVVEFLRTSSPRRPDHSREVNNRVLVVVTTVRNLLYVTATPLGHIPSHLYPRVQDGRSTSSSQALQTHLKGAHRKVAGMLSKLVLSALAMQYDPSFAANDKPNRMETDAAELERSVMTFMADLQRFQQEHGARPSDIKRLYAVFSSARIGSGLPGAGLAGDWRGFGYATLPSGQSPSRQLLDTNTVVDLRDTAGTIQKLLDALKMSLQRPDLSQERVQSTGCFLIAYMSSFLAFVCDINIAQHVDIDAVRAGSSRSPTHIQYVQSVEKGRTLLRMLEVACQALYDGAALLLSSVQSLSLARGTSEELTARLATWETASATIGHNLGAVLNILDSLLDLGFEQAGLEQAAYNGAIEWRRSRPSVFFDSETPDFAMYEGEEDVVDMELAFSRQGFRTMAMSADSQSSTIYNDSAQQSDTSLEASDKSRSDGVGEPVTPTWPQHDTSDVGTLVASAEADPDSDLLDDDAGLFDEGPSNTKSPPKAAKLYKIFGAEPPQHYINQVNADSQPWYLRPNYDQAEILIDPDGGVRAGSKPALVERLTAHETADPTFAKNFMITFKSFMTLDELFDLLVARFWIQPPDTLTQDEIEIWTKQKQVMIRLRVLNTFRTMVTDEDVLEKGDMYILDRIKEFVSKPEVSNSVAAAKQLVVLIDRVQRGGEGPIKTTATTSQAPPPPILPKATKKLKLLDIDPLELARQLTLMEASMYKKIRPTECLQRSREQRAKNTDNIASIIQLSNRIANWVAESVLSKEDSRKRAAVVKHFINVADRCRLLQNFSTMVAITSGLNTPPIRRLKRTWEQVNQRFAAQLSICESTIDSNKNFNNYRSTLARITPPCVPFIGTYLTTLTFINDGAEDNVAGHMINFRKRQKAAEVIQDIKRWQSAPYNFQVVAQVLAFLEESFGKYQDGVDYGDQFWHLSLDLEPREREDEKMARLLQESGFL